MVSICRRRCSNCRFTPANSRLLASMPRRADSSSAAMVLKEVTSSPSSSAASIHGESATVFAFQIGKRRQLPAQFVPCRRGIQSSDQVLSGKCQGKTALQGLLALAKFIYQQRIVAAAIRLLGFRQYGQLLRFGAGIIQRVTGELSGDLTGIGAQFLHWRGKPLLNRAVHQPIREQEQ